MKRRHEEIIENQDVVLDGYEWFGCSFNNCNIIINTGNFSFKNNSLNSCRLSVGDPAANILSIVELFYPGTVPFAPGSAPNPRGKDIF